MQKVHVVNTVPVNIAEAGKAVVPVRFSYDMGGGADFHMGSGGDGPSGPAGGRPKTSGGFFRRLAHQEEKQKETNFRASNLKWGRMTAVATTGMHKEQKGKWGFIRTALTALVAGGGIAGALAFLGKGVAAISGGLLGLRMMLGRGGFIGGTLSWLKSLFKWKFPDFKKGNVKGPKPPPTQQTRTDPKTKPRQAFAHGQVPQLGQKPRLVGRWGCECSPSFHDRSKAAAGGSPQGAFAHGQNAWLVGFRKAGRQSEDETYPT